MRLRASLAVIPAPSEPMCNRGSAKVSSTGRAASRACGDPPAKTTILPIVRKPVPPVTPQSRSSTCRRAADCAAPRSVSTVIVLSTHTVAGGESAARIPSTPSSTSRSCSSSYTAINTVPHASARSLTPSLRDASGYSSKALSRTSYPNTSQPPRLSVRATGPPIAPRPITPTGCPVASSGLLSGIACTPLGRNGCGLLERVQLGGVTP